MTTPQTERNHLTPTCIAGFNKLVEPQGYKGAQDKRYWSISVKMDAETGKEFIKTCQGIADKAFEELVAKRKAMGRQINENARPSPNYKIDPFGNYVITFRRKESKITPPHVLDYNRVPTNELVKQGAKVQVAFNLYAYVLPTNNTPGVSFELIAVRIMDKEPEREQVSATFNRIADDSVNLDDLF